MTSNDIEIAIARYFNYRMNLIVPNVSWGLFHYGMEVDLLVVRPSGWAIEVEIKVSASDIKRDLKKMRNCFPRPWQHELIRNKYFAIPEKLKDHPDIPIGAGILAVPEEGPVQLIRSAYTRKQARKLTPLEIDKVKSLGCMRIWTLKEKLNNKYHLNRIGLEEKSI